MTRWGQAPHSFVARRLSPPATDGQRVTTFFTYSSRYRLTLPINLPLTLVLLLIDFCCP